MNIFLTVNKNWVVSQKQSFLLKANRDNFANLTRDKIIVYDENFLLKEENKNLLKNKMCFCYLPNGTKEEDEKVITNFTTLFERLSFYKPDNVFGVGEGELEEQLLPYCHKAYVTKIEENKAIGKTFPNLDKKPNWELVKTSNPIYEDGVLYYFCEYVNKKPLKFNYGYEEEDLF